MLPFRRLLVWTAAYRSRTLPFRCRPFRSSAFRCPTSFRAFLTRARFPADKIPPKTTEILFRVRAACRPDRTPLLKGFLTTRCLIRGLRPSCSALTQTWTSSFRRPDILRRRFPPERRRISTRRCCCSRAELGSPRVSGIRRRRLSDRRAASF